LAHWPSRSCYATMARNDGSMTTEDGDVMVDGGDLCRIEQLPWTLITYPYTFNPVCEGNSWVQVNLLAEKLSEAPKELNNPLEIKY